VDVVEDVTGLADWGRAVIDDEGTVRPAAQRMDFYRGDAIRARAVCSEPKCRHQWTLRRRFDPTAPA
jgi:uncharacterized protein YijF (DUF1287 family)